MFPITFLVLQTKCLNKARFNFSFLILNRHTETHLYNCNVNVNDDTIHVTQMNHERV